VSAWPGSVGMRLGGSSVRTDTEHLSTEDVGELES
jgi:hypothetical protein